MNVWRMLNSDKNVWLGAREIRLLDIHSELYPFVMYDFTGDAWKITSPDYDEEFDTCEEFIEFIKTELKEALLEYAINGELGEIAEV